MDYKQLQEILTQDIEQLKHLRDVLSNDGEPLTADNKQLLRNQLSGNWLSAMQRDQKFFFASGDEEDMIHGFDRLIDVIKQLQ